MEPEGGRAVIRDYKSGATRPEYRGSNWQAEQRLQVALYMVAVRQLLGLEPVAGLYQPLGGKDLRARGVFLDGTPVEVVGKQIFEEILEVASGKKTKSERNGVGEEEFAPWSIGPTL